MEYSQNTIIYKLNIYRWPVAWMASNRGPSNSFITKYVSQLVSARNSSPVSELITGTPNDRAASTVFESSMAVPMRQIRYGVLRLWLLATVVVVGVGDTDGSEIQKKESI